jgi:hypothetical protein
MNGIETVVWPWVAGHPRWVAGGLAIGLLWVLIHARPRLTSGYERQMPQVWAARRNRYVREHGKWCRACLLWNLLAVVPVAGGMVRWVRRRTIQVHHWRYGAVGQEGQERDLWLSCLCTDMWPDHHGDADDWRRFGESLPLVGRWAWIVMKPAFFLTAFLCQLVITAGILGGIAAGLFYGIPFLAQHVTVSW